MWELMVSAQSRPDGIPEAMFNAKKQALLQENVRPCAWDMIHT